MEKCFSSLQGSYFIANFALVNPLLCFDLLLLRTGFEINQSATCFHGVHHRNNFRTKHRIKTSDTEPTYCIAQEKPRLLGSC